MTRHIGLQVGLIAASLALAACDQSGSTGDEPWRTSWAELATAVDSFRADAEKASPESPDFPMAGMKMRIGGEELSSGWPVMRRFGGSVVFEGQFKGIENRSDDTLPGQPFMILMEMPKTSVDGFAVALTYPRGNAVEKWRSLKPGDTVRFRANIQGIAASDASAGTIGLLLNVADQTSTRHLREAEQNTFLYKRGPYIYYITMTNAEPVD